MLRNPPRVHWLLVLLVCAAEAEAQTPGRLALTAAAGVGGHQPSYAPLSAPGVWGVGIGAEMRLARDVIARVSANYLRSASNRDDLSICMAPEPPWEPGSNCFEPNYAAWYGLFTADAVVRPAWSGPVYGVGGAGWTEVSRQPYVFDVPPATGLPNGRAIWRYGAGFVLGRSPRAPRLEMTTTRFAGRIGTATSVTTLQLWMR